MVLYKILALFFGGIAIILFLLAIIFILIPFGEFTFVFLLLSFLAAVAAYYFWKKT
jgi:hypothetical protein